MNAQPPEGARQSARVGERIAKRMARAGLCSRREAEQWIAQGRVSVDGVTLASPACVVTDRSVIAVDGKTLGAPERVRLFRYHKPEGLIVSAHDPQGRPTVFERLPPGLPRLISVGRLDLNSQGLLLLTNDGAVARKLELPANGWTRRYRVRVHGEVDEAKLASLSKGVTIEGIHYGAIEAKLERRQRSNAWIAIALTEGKNREIRRIMDYLGLPVSRLIRVAFGPFSLGDLPPGAIAEVDPRSVDAQLGLAPPAKKLGWAKAKPRAKPSHKKHAHRRG